MAVGVRTGDLIEVVDEANQVVLIFPDDATLADYDRSQIDRSIPFDYARIEQQALALSDRLASFVDDLRLLHVR